MLEVNEEIDVDPYYLERAFKNGIKKGKINYLKELENLSINDNQLESNQFDIYEAFEQIIKISRSDEDFLNSLTLKEFKNFGLNRMIVDRIGYLAFQFDNLSPTPSIRGNRLFEKEITPSSIQTEDDYEDEIFEEIDDEDLVETVNNNPKASNPSLSNATQNNISGKRNGVDSQKSRYNNQVPNPNRNIYTSQDISLTKKYPTSYGSSPTKPKVRIKNDTGTKIHFMENVDNKNGIDPEDFIEEDNNVDMDGQFSPVKSKMVPKKSFNNKIRSQSATVTPNSNVELVGGSSSQSHSILTALDIARQKALEDEKRASTAGFRKRGRPAAWIVNHEWKLGEKIGKGSFGEVFQAMNNKGKLFAVKVMNMTDKQDEQEDLIAEIQLMRGLSHPNIVEYIGAWVDSNDCSIYIFQEWVPGGSVAHLLKKFGPFSLGVVRNYTRQILLGLEYLHLNAIIHRDIKGGNVLVDDNGTAKLADFGASTRLSSFDMTQETTTIKGTPYFMAPEVLTSSKYGRKGDIWAVGCTMIQMLTGDPPWKDRNLHSLVQLHLLLESWNQGPPPHDCYTSPEAEDCLQMCFRKNEQDRPTATQLLNCKFLAEDDFDESQNMEVSGNHLDDSGVIDRLKQEMAKAISRSSLALNKGGDEDTMAYIDKQIEQRNYQDTKVPKEFSIYEEEIKINKNIPFPDPLPHFGPNTPERHDRYYERNSSSTNSKTPPARSKLDGDVYSHLSAMKSQSNPGTPIQPMNQRGKDLVIAPAQVSQQNPFGRRTNPKRAAITEEPPIPANPFARNARPGNQSPEEIRESLVNLKKKTANYNQRSNAGMGRYNRGPSSSLNDSSVRRMNRIDGNQSSHRDSEELTPLPDDSEDEAEDSYPKSSRRMPRSNYLPEPYPHEYGMNSSAAGNDQASWQEEEGDNRFHPSISSSGSNSKQVTPREVLQSDQADEKDIPYDLAEQPTPAMMDFDEAGGEDEEPYINFQANSKVDRLRNIRHVKKADLGMKKSSSVASSLSMKQPVQKSSHGGVNRSVGTRSSISSRSSNRPNTSKASLASGRPRDTPPVSSSSSSASSQLALPIATQHLGEPWKCLKCGFTNTHPRHCENCATLRGADGKRGAEAPLHIC